MSRWEGKPNPGSPESYKLGCICARMDNNNGKWAPWPPDGWWITEGCPVHALCMRCYTKIGGLYLCTQCMWKLCAMCRGTGKVCDKCAISQPSGA